MKKTRRAPTEQLSPGFTAGGVAFEVVLASAGDGPDALPEWIQLTPRGVARTRDNRGFNFNPEALVDAWRADVVKRLPVDFEHETEFTPTLGAKPARAWIVELEARPAGLFGRIEWGEDAATALRARHYRYVSPTFYLDADKATARLLKAAALVTSPALGMPALASAQTSEDTMDFAVLLAALGLPATASEADATSAIAALRAGDPNQFVPKAQHDQTVAALSAAQADIARRDQEALTARCSALVDGAIADGRLAPGAREQYLALASSNFDGTKAAIEAMPVIAPTKRDEGGGDGEAAKLSGNLSDAERAVARNMGLSDEAYLAARGASAA